MSIPAVPPIQPLRRTDAQGEHTRPAPLPEMPKPLTPAAAAVHLMKVPSTRLLEAFIAVERAFDRQGDTAPTKQDAKRLEKAVSPPAPPAQVDLKA